MKKMNKSQKMGTVPLKWGQPFFSKMAVPIGRAQTFLEYAIIIIVAAAALLAMRVYFVRSVQDKFRQSADVFGGGAQYAAGKTEIAESYSKSPGQIDPADRKDTCPEILVRVKALEDEINGRDLPVGCQPPDCKHMSGLLDLALRAEAQAADIDAQIEILNQNGMTSEAASLTKSARTLRQKAQDFRAGAQLLQAQIDQLKQGRPECF